MKIRKYFILALLFLFLEWSDVYANETLVTTVEYDGNNTTAYYDHTDHLSGTGVVTSSTGSTVQALDYFPFGSVRLNDKAGAFDEKRQYAGSEFDSDTGLNYMNARYYKSEVGRFAAQDPVSRDVPETFLWDPQQLNYYAYARNNPMRYIDPLGLYNIETWEVEKGDTLGDITRQINEHYETSYTVDQIWNLNNIENINRIYVGQVIIPNKEVPDITNDLMSKMEEHAKDKKIQNPFYFKSKVKKGGDWDLKNQSWIYCSNSSCGGQEHQNYVFNWEKIRYDAPGNIHYGYVWSATWFGSPETLHYFAGTAQNQDNNTTTGDDQTDSGYINMGIKIYNER